MTNNDKALAALERVLRDARYGIGSNDHEIMNAENYKKEMTQHGEDADTILQALTSQSSADLGRDTATIEQVEGLYEAMERVEDACQQYGARAYYMPEDIGSILEAARLYAQGRTESEMSMTDFIGVAKGKLHDDYCANPMLTTMSSLETIGWAVDKIAGYGLSTTPPVTAPIEKVDGLADAIHLVQDERQNYNRDVGDAFDLVLKAARLQLQRQGD